MDTNLTIDLNKSSVDEQFRLPGHTDADLMVTVLLQKKFEGQIQHGSAELRLIKIFNIISPVNVNKALELP